MDADDGAVLFSVFVNVSTFIYNLSHICEIVDYCVGISRSAKTVNGSEENII